MINAPLKSCFRSLRDGQRWHHLHTRTTINPSERVDGPMQVHRPHWYRRAAPTALAATCPTSSRTAPKPVRDPDWSATNGRSLRRPGTSAAPVHRQGESRLADKYIAFELFKGNAGRVVLTLVVPGDDPDLPAVLDPHLRGPEDVPSGMQRHVRRTQRKLVHHIQRGVSSRSPPSLNFAIEAPGRATMYLALPWRRWSPCACVITAFWTGFQGSM